MNPTRFFAEARIRVVVIARAWKQEKALTRTGLVHGWLVHYDGCGP